jgi:hypothetical protein
MKRVRRRSAVEVGLRTVVVAVLLSVTLLTACDKKPNDPATSATADPPTPSMAARVPAATAPLPAPEVLTDVLYKLADTSVPGEQKVPLVEGATADEGANLDKFGKALADSGLTPLGFTATDIAWSDTAPGNIAAKVTVHSENPSLANGFTFPMEFRPYFGTWQLSRKTADMLLALGSSPKPTP